MKPIVSRFIPFMVVFCAVLFAQNAYAQNSSDNEFIPPAVLATVLGVLAPLVVQQIKAKLAHRLTRFLVSCLLVLATAVLCIVLSGQWDSTDLAASFSWVFIAAYGSYNLWWHGLFDFLNKKKAT